MATPTTLDASTLERLRGALESLEGVTRAVLDPAAGAICLICDLDAEAAPLDPAVRTLLLAEGVDPAALTIEVVGRPGHGARRRVRFRGVERICRAPGQTSLQVTLEWQGRVYTGEATGEMTPAIEMRTAATAAIEAVMALLGPEAGLRLTGVKQVRAFDTELIITSIHRVGAVPQHFVGAVLAGENPLRSASISVLDALNRMMGNFLATTD